MTTLHNKFCATLTAISIALCATAFSPQSGAHNSNDLSAISILSALPVASVLVMGGAVGTSAVGASVAGVALPVALSATGAVLVSRVINFGTRKVPNFRVRLGAKHSNS